MAEGKNVNDNEDAAAAAAVVPTTAAVVPTGEDESNSDNDSPYSPLADPESVDNNS